MLPPYWGGDIVEFPIANFDAALRWAIHAEQQFHQGRFSTARCAHYGSHFALWYGEVDVFQDIMRQSIVFEGDIFEVYPMFGELWKFPEHDGEVDKYPLSIFYK